MILPFFQKLEFLGSYSYDHEMIRGTSILSFELKVSTLTVLIFTIFVPKINSLNKFRTFLNLRICL